MFTLSSPGAGRQAVTQVKSRGFKGTDVNVSFRDLLVSRSHAEPLHMLLLLMDGGSVDILESPLRAFLLLLKREYNIMRLLLIYYFL